MGIDIERAKRAKQVLLVVSRVATFVDTSKNLAAVIEPAYAADDLYVVLYDQDQSAISDLESLMPYITAVIAWAPIITEVVDKVIREAPKVRWVHSRFAGTDLVVSTPELLKATHVTMTVTRTVSDQVLAEWALATALFFAKDLRRLQKQSESRTWERFMPNELRGHTLTVVGFGGIGKAVSRLALAFGMRVIGVRRRLGAPEEDGVQCVGPESLHEVLAESDYVVLSMPLTSETKNVISDAEFKAMKKGAVIVNIGRGPTLDEDALLRALDEGKVRGAALDVTAVEPLPQDSKLWGRDDIILSPHCALMTDHLGRDQIIMAKQLVDRFMKGEPLINAIDKEAGY